MDFFPIDNIMFGNELEAHNYHFTFEVSSYFIFREGASITMGSQDDAWLFINNQLVIDLGEYCIVSFDNY